MNNSNDPVVKVRFAPSPSGFLHIGGARTALFNYLFAKKRGGKFIVRIDDTDASKSSDDSIRSILSDLKWLGLDWDHGLNLSDLSDMDSNGPYRASNRKDIYSSYAKDLIVSGKAYLFTDTDGSVVTKFKTPKDNDIIFFDDIRGKMVSPKDSIDDFVIIRSNGMATYNFATVIDDHLMGITHIYRADEHLTNTFKHVLLFNAFNWPVPKFGHMALIFGSDRSKLSKRHGATSIDDFRKKGYTKDALINYISMLGWGHPKARDIYSFSDLMDSFSIKKVNPSPAIFDMDKLNYINASYIKKMTDADLLKIIDPYINDFNISYDVMLKAIPVFRTGWKTLSDSRRDFKNLISNDFFDDAALDFVNTANSKTMIHLFKNYLDNSSDVYLDFNHLISFLKDNGFSGKVLMWTLRTIFIGSTDGPAIDLMTRLISKDILSFRTAVLINLVDRRGGK